MDKVRTSETKAVETVPVTQKLATKTTAEQSPPTHKEDPLLTITEVAERLGKSHTTIRRWIDDGLLPAVRMPSGLFNVRQSEANRFLETTTLTARV